MHNLMLGIEITAAGVILLRCFHIGASLAWNEWKGHPLQFVLMSLSYPLMAGGSIGILLSREGGYMLLLVGVMFLMLADRRKVD